MAKATAVKATENTEITDTRTGEVMGMAVRDNTTSDALEASTQAILGSGDFVAKLDKVAAAKPESFQKLEADFWKPGAPGTADAIIQGIFLGSAKIERLIQHAVGIKGQKGQPVVVRFNGGHSLTNQLKQVTPGEGVRVEFLGKKTSLGLTSANGQGNAFGEWKVTKLSV